MSYMFPWLTTLSVDDAFLSPWKTYDRDQNHNVLAGSMQARGSAIFCLEPKPCTVIINDVHWLCRSYVYTEY